MKNVMGQHYKIIKDRLGIDDLLANSSEDEIDPYISKSIPHLIYFSAKSKENRRSSRSN
jgi:hypothetical protein